jgi:hypothetical protein
VLLPPGPASRAAVLNNLLQNAVEANKLRVQLNGLIDAIEAREKQH